MKIKCVLSQRDCGKGGFSVEVNGEEVFEIGAGEPEDNTFYRDLNGVREIPRLIDMVFDAGARGEVLDITWEESGE